MKRRIALGLVTLAAVVVSACNADYDRLELTKQPSKIGGDITRSRLVVPVGMIVKAHLAPIDDDQEVMNATVTVLDDSILDAASVVSEADFAFIGLKPGETEIILKADGKTVLIIPTTVTEQNVSPDNADV